MSVDVVRLITRLNIGGPARQALLLSRTLNDDYPTLLAAGWPGPAEGELSDAAVTVRRVPLTRELSPRTDVAALASVRHLLRSSGARLLHTHMAKAGTVGRTAAIRLPDPPRTVHTFHGHVLDGYFSRPVRQAFLAVERQLAKRTDVLLAVSPEIRDALLDLGIGRPSQFHVMPVGLDLSTYLAMRDPSGRFRTELGLDAGTPLVGTVGRLVPIKDHATLLRAMKQLPGVHLAIVGDGELRSRLEAVAVTLDLVDRVHFVGWRHDLADIYADCDVVVLTSLNEGTPVALIEALAAGRPVVATDVGGVRHVVTDSRTGLLAPSGDDHAIAARVGDLLADRTRAARLGEAGRTDVAARFGADRLVADMGDLYATLIPASLWRSS